MPFKTGLIRGALGDRCIHLCVDMQNLFGPSSPWHVPWTETVSPNIVEICSRHPAKTVFTRFIPPKTPESTFGMWKRYYQKWEMLTLDRIDPALIQLIEPLQKLSPPAVLLDKRVYSPWTEGALQRHLNTRNIHTVIISGAETDLCVFAALLGAVDLGYRTILVSDAVCSVSDQAHDAVISLCHERFSEQLELVRTDELIESWR